MGSRYWHLAPSRGFTNVEILVAVLIFSGVMTLAVSFLQVQDQSFKKGLDYMATVQNLRKTVEILEKDIQTAGTNLAAGQPGVVFADSDVLAFNADYATGTRLDPLSVFFEPDLDDRDTRSWSPDRRDEIPGSSLVYPDSAYLDDVARQGSAETLVFFFVSADETLRDDDYALYRQVNDDEPRLVARNLLRVGDEPFFRYLTETEAGVDSIPGRLLPLTHIGSAQESAMDSLPVHPVESIRGVRVTVAVTNGNEGELERISETTRIVRMPNLGLETKEICGRPPILGTALSATLDRPVSGEPIIKLAWGRATDEARRERDIVRYVIWRKESISGDWDEPYLSIPAGEDSYIYRDADLVPGETYVYALAAQDCTPRLSPMAISGPISVPTTNISSAFSRPVRGPEVRR